MGLFILGVEVDDEMRGVWRVRENTKRGRVDSSQCVRIARIPACDLRVVVQLVGDIPPEDHIAKAEALLQRRPELLEADVFASQHAIDVETTDLDLLDASFVEVATQLFAHRSSSGAGSIPLFEALWAAFLGRFLGDAVNQPQPHHEQERDGRVAEQLVRGARNRAVRFEYEVAGETRGGCRDEAAKRVSSVD